jgi:hypothetical protein
MKLCYSTKARCTDLVVVFQINQRESVLKSHRRGRKEQVISYVKLKKENLMLTDNIPRYRTPFIDLITNIRTTHVNAIFGTPLIKKICGSMTIYVRNSLTPARRQGLAIKEDVFSGQCLVGSCQLSVASVLSFDSVSAGRWCSQQRLL